MALSRVPPGARLRLAPPPPNTQSHGTLGPLPLPISLGFRVRLAPPPVNTYKITALLKGFDGVSSGTPRFLWFELGSLQKQRKTKRHPTRVTRDHGRRGTSIPPQIELGLALLTAPSCSWLLLAAPGRSWPLLAAPRCSLAVLAQDSRAPAGAPTGAPPSESRKYTTSRTPTRTPAAF